MNVTFIGLGKMGTAMVERLLQAGYPVTVYNRTPSKMLPLTQLGALPAGSLAEAIQNAHCVMSSLLDDNAVKTITQGMLASLPKEALHIGLSTVLPDTAKELVNAHQQHGSHYISAVVLGIPKVAQAGRLTTFYAGQEAQIERAIPLLKAFSEQVIPMGERIHLPNVMKICMNYSLVTAIELISELYVFAEKSGLDTEYVKMALHQIYTHPAFKQYVDKIDEKRFEEVNFDMVGGNKDVTLFQQAFAQVGVSPELANIAKSRFIAALAQGKEKKDWSAIYEVIRQQAGLNN